MLCQMHLRTQLAILLRVLAARCSSASCLCLWHGVILWLPQTPLRCQGWYQHHQGDLAPAHFHSRSWWHPLLGCKGSCRSHRVKQVARKINRMYTEPERQSNFFALCFPQQSLRHPIPGFGKQLVSNGCREQRGSEPTLQRGSGVKQGVFLRAVSSVVGAGPCCLPQSLHTLIRQPEGPSRKPEGSFLTGQGEMALYCKSVGWE